MFLISYLFILLQKSFFLQVTQLVGFCVETGTLVTEYFPLQDLAKVHDILQKRSEDTAVYSLQMCLQYTQLLDFMHNSPIGKK